MNKTIWTAAALAIGFVSATATANTITVAAVAGNLYQQGVQSPCIFSNPSCQDPAGWVGTALPTGGAVTGYDALSPIYSGATILGIIGNGNPLRIGLDINENNDAQTLSMFEMIKNGSVVDTFSFAGTGNVPAGNNGNGYADYLLANFSTFAAGDTIRFHFVFNNANDGTENVFLIGGTGVVPDPVPEPSTLLLLGLGLAGLGLSRKRKAT